MDVVLAGPGVGGVAIAVGSGQHPLAAGPAGKAPAHADAACFVQRQRLGQRAVRVPDVEGDDTPVPLLRQAEFQLVHTLGFLCAQMQPVGLGEEFCAAEVPGCDVDLHGKTPFIWFCVCIWPDCSAERQWAEVHTFLLRIWRVRHFAKRPFSERNRPLLFS